LIRGCFDSGVDGATCEVATDARVRAAIGIAARGAEDTARRALRLSIETFIVCVLYSDECSGEVSTSVTSGYIWPFPVLLMTVVGGGGGGGGGGRTGLD